MRDTHVVGLVTNVRMKIILFRVLQTTLCFIHIIEFVCNNSSTWCKTIVTPYIKGGSYNSFTPSPQFILIVRQLMRIKLLFLMLTLFFTENPYAEYPELKCSVFESGPIMHPSADRVVSRDSFRSHLDSVGNNLALSYKNSLPASKFCMKFKILI